jgi:hypothetical protein
MKQCVLTTIDNVYNPFTQFDEWFAYDVEHHYHTCELLAMFSKASPNLEEDDYNHDISNAIDRFLAINPYGLHMKVYEDEAETLIPLANKVYKETFKAADSK